MSKLSTLPESGMRLSRVLSDVRECPAVISSSVSLSVLHRWRFCHHAYSHDSLLSQHIVIMSSPRIFHHTSFTVLPTSSPILSSKIQNLHTLEPAHCSEIMLVIQLTQSVLIRRVLLRIIDLPTSDEFRTPHIVEELPRSSSIFVWVPDADACWSMLVMFDVC